MTIEKQFYQGNFAQIIEKQKSIKSDDICYLIGALSFSGQIQEAQRLQKHFKKYDQLSYFFLALGWTRASQYKKAREIFLIMQGQAHKLFEQFLLAQGMAFFNYFTCRFLKAERWLNRAHEKLPNEFNNSFWDLILKDLTFYVYVKRGKIIQGKENAQEALVIAKKIKNRFTVEAIEISLIIHESTYGLDQSRSFVDLKRMLDQYKNKSTFYYTQLAFEYIRRLNLNGQFSVAEKTLEQLKKIVFQSQVQRHKAIWCFRQAHLLFLQGKNELSLSTLNSAEEYLVPEQDLYHHIEILGLKYKIEKKCKIENQATEKLLRELIFTSKDAMSLSYAYRYGWYSKPINEDPHVYFFHQWIRNGYQNLQSLNKVHKQGWYSLFVDLLPAEHEQFIYLDFMPKKAILFNEQGINVLEGLTQLMRQALLVLNRHQISKKEFVELVWGYEYDSYRHDPLIYTVIGRLRDFLKDSSEHLILQEHQIQLRNTKVRVFEHEKIIEKSENDLIQKNSELQFNFRQIELLDFASKNKYFSIEQVMKEFSVSRMTAFRDLRKLVELNQLKRAGTGRATRYSIQFRSDLSN